MAIINMRDLSRNPRKVLEALENLDAAEACLITRHGRPLAALVPVDEADADAFLIAASPELAEMRRDAEAALAEGKPVPLSEFAASLGVDLEAEKPLPEEQRSELIEAAAGAQEALALATNGHESKAAQADDRELGPQELVELNRPLLAHFTDATTPGIAGEAAVASEPAVNTVVEFNAAVKPLATERLSAYEVYMAGALHGVERYRHLERQHSQSSPSGGRRMRIRRKRRTR